MQTHDPSRWMLLGPQHLCNHLIHQPGPFCHPAHSLYELLMAEVMRVRRQPSTMRCTPCYETPYCIDTRFSYSFYSFEFISVEPKPMVISRHRCSVSFVSSMPDTSLPAPPVLVMQKEHEQGEGGRYAFMLSQKSLYEGRLWERHSAQGIGHTLTCWSTTPTSKKLLLFALNQV